MYSLDNKKGSGGFIHGFRYLIKLFTQINYNVPKTIVNFEYDENLCCYNDLSNLIFKRINISSSLYQLYGVMCDIFYYDEINKNIVYIQDWKKDCLKYLNINNKFINILYLEYGNENTEIDELGTFNKWNPTFLHPKIYIHEYKNNICKLIDRITFDEDLIADFSDNHTYFKIKQTLKMCNLVPLINL